LAKKKKKKNVPLAAPPRIHHQHIKNCIDLLVSIWLSSSGFSPYFYSQKPIISNLIISKKEEKEKRKKQNTGNC